MRQRKPARPKRERTAATEGTLQIAPAWTRWLCGLLVLLAVLFTTVRPIMDPDTWFHLAFGKLATEQGSLPRTDVFSHTSAGNEWISSGWLASVLMYRLYELSESGAGLIWMSFVIIAAAYLISFVAVVRWYGAPGNMATLLILGAGISIARFSPRPDLWSQLGIASVILLLLQNERHAVRHSRPTRLLWLLPVVLCAWANLHAGFLAGLLASAIYAFWLLYRIVGRAERWRSWMLLPVALSCLSWMLNPYGPRLVALARKIQETPDAGWVMEWMPLFRTGFLPAPAALLLMALFVLLAGQVLWSGRARLSGWHVGIVALFIALSLLQRRQVGLASIAIPLAIAPAFSASPAMASHSRRLGIALASGALLLVALLHYRGSLISNRSFLRVGINCTALPCDGTDYLRLFRPSGNMFNSYGIGGFLLFHLGPEAKVFIDGRLDVYDHQVWQDYLAADDGRLPVPEVEKRYGIKTWVVAIENAVKDPEHLASRLVASRDHALVYFDDNVAVFISRSALAAPHKEFVHATPWNSTALRQLGRAALLDAAEEVDRAIEYSNGSANAWSLAALVASAAGDQEGMATALHQARIRNEKSPLLKTVQQLLR